MSPLSPFPIRGATAEPLLSDDFTAFASNGWVATGDAVLVDDWFDDDDHILLFAEYLGFWANNPAVEQNPGARSTRITKTYEGLPPNRLVAVQVGVAFYAQDFGAAGKWVGMEVNGAKFEPNVTASGTGTPNIGLVTGVGRTNGDGEITIAFGVDNLTVSCDLHIFFDNLVITPMAAELADIFYDAGVLYVDGNGFSITRGGAAAPFDPGEEWESYEFPGFRAPVEGCDELVRCRPTIRVRCMLTGEYQFTVYRPDGTWADHATIDGARVYTLAAMGAALSASKYPKNVIVVWPRQRGDYVGVHFPVALGRRFTMSSADKDEGGLDMEFEARIPAGEPLTTVPYRIVTYAENTEAVG